MSDFLQEKVNIMAKLLEDFQCRLKNLEKRMEDMDGIKRDVTKTLLTEKEWDKYRKKEYERIYGKITQKAWNEHKKYHGDS